MLTPRYRIGVESRMMKEGIDLRLELCSDTFEPGETIYGDLTINSGHPVEFKAGSLTWRTLEVVPNSGTDGDHPNVLMDVEQKIILPQGNKIVNHQVVPINFTLPDSAAPSMDAQIGQSIKVCTMLIISANFGDPINASIIRDYPINIVKPNLISGGLLQSIEFPMRQCCSRETTAVAHIELLQTCFSPGESIQATVVTDLTKASADVKAITIQLKRYIIWKEVDSEQWNVDEYEFEKGPKSISIRAGNKTAATISAFIPEDSFVPDIETERIFVRHTALFLFHTPKYVAESEIPISLNNPMSA